MKTANEVNPLNQYKHRTGYIEAGWNFPAGNFTVIGIGQNPRSLEIAYANGNTMEFDADFIIKNLSN